MIFLGLVCFRIFMTFQVRGRFPTWTRRFSGEGRGALDSCDGPEERLPGGFMSLPELLKDQIRPLGARNSAGLIKRMLSLDEVDALFDNIAASRRDAVAR